MNAPAWQPVLDLMQEARFDDAVTAIDARRVAAPLDADALLLRGVAHAAASVVCALATITSLYETSVANNAVIGATAPFAAALLARVFLGERVPLRTLVAGAVALVGVAVVVSGSLGGGRLRGDLLAVVMMLSFATMIVVSRARPTMPVAGADATIRPSPSVR